MIPGSGMRTLKTKAATDKYTVKHTFLPLYMHFNARKKAAGNLRVFHSNLECILRQFSVKFGRRRRPKNFSVFMVISSVFKLNFGAEGAGNFW